MPWSTFHRKLQSAIKHAREAAARFYAENQAPEQYIEHLADVEVEPEPVDVPSLVLSVYQELKSIRKTADHLGLNREKVRRIVNVAA